MVSIQQTTTVSPTERVFPSQAKIRQELACAHREMCDTGVQFTVLFLNVDGFRVVNETLGHEIGDDLLADFAARIQGSLRPQDFVGHFGADEYVIIARGVNALPHIESIVRRIRESISRSYKLNGQELTFSASLGVVIAAPHYLGPDDILRDASIALRQAKSMGKARHQVFDATLQRNTQELLGLEADLHVGFESGEFEVFYQPFVSIALGQIVGFEALLRWNRAGHELVSPADFIPIAERTGLIVPLGTWVLRQAALQLEKWNARFPERDLTMGINVASQQLSQTDLVTELAKLLETLSICPQQIELEITESDIIANKVAASEVMEQLHRFGVRLSIDDFGTGYSSLSQLYHYPFDTLKIDRLFVKQLGINKKSTVFVEAIVRLAKDLNLAIVAEGIETQKQLELLEDMGCDIGQGYYFSQPGTHEDASALLHDSQFSSAVY